MVGSVGGAVWLGAWVASAIAGGRLRASFADAVAAASRLPTNLGNPRLAWPDEVRAPTGSLLYWSVTVVLLVTTLAIVVVVFRLVSKSWLGPCHDIPLVSTPCSIRHRS